MTRYAALLRAVNLGAKRQVPMAKLKVMMEELGYENSATYLQSGNAVFDANGSAAQVGTALERALEKEFGFDVPVIIRSKAQIQKIVDGNPHRAAEKTPKLMHVVFCSDRPSVVAVKKIADLGIDGESLTLVGNDIYAWTPNGVGNSKMMTALNPKKLGIEPTARNWETVRKLLELLNNS